MRPDLNILHLDSGRGWDLVTKLISERCFQLRGRLSAAATLRHQYFLLGDDQVAYFEHVVSKGQDFKLFSGRSSNQDLVLVLSKLDFLRKDEFKLQTRTSSGSVLDDQFESRNRYRVVVKRNPDLIRRQLAIIGS
ncbi:Uncharacterized protein Adt_24799 [Abeliophyllum distichum]|uniref:Uncharacterized protein n=1 Tax=Abeliophyllum distichum TaxID=126358 RepID=A0ABD1SET4_9LAMI